MRNLDFPQFAGNILERLETAGFEAWLVGGCVRDALLCRTPNDWDIATSAVPEEVMAVLEKTVPTGIRFGTVTVFCGGGKAEVTTFRSEAGYDDFRRPSVVRFGGDIKTDLSRRDFTVNAMAYHPRWGLFDPFDGGGDLERRLVRAVGNASLRFQEDALRILRAFRFAAQLDFAIEAHTLRAAADCAPLVEKVSGERIKSELDKTLLSDNPQRALELAKTEALGFLGISAPQTDVPERIPATLPSRWAAFFALCRLDSTPADVMGRLHFDIRTRGCVLQMLSELERGLPETPAELKRQLSTGMSPELYREFLLLYGALTARDTARVLSVLDAILECGEPYSLAMLAVNGGDLVNAGIAAGPECGRILKALLDAVIEDPALNEKSTLLRLAKRV